MGQVFSLRRSGIDPTAGLVVSEDDYSVRVTRTDDQRFWLRLEKPSGGELVVSDCLLGDADEAVMGAACALAVRQLGLLRPERVVFRDVVAGGHQTADFPRKMLLAGERAKRLAKAVATATGRQCGCLEMSSRRGRLDAAVGLD